MATHPVVEPVFFQMNLIPDDNMEISFSQFRMDDGKITSIVIGNGRIDVFVRNWQEANFVLSFDDMIGFEGNNPVEEELSHGEDILNDAFLEHCCAVGQEQLNEFRCYRFYSAWSDTPILKIVARCFSLTSPNVESSA